MGGSRAGSGSLTARDCHPALCVLPPVARRSRSRNERRPKPATANAHFRLLPRRQRERGALPGSSGDAYSPRASASQLRSPTDSDPEAVQQIGPRSSEPGPKRTRMKSGATVVVSPGFATSQQVRCPGCQSYSGRPWRVSHCRRR